MIIASLSEAAAQMGQTAKWLRLLANQGVTPKHLQHAIDNRAACVNLATYLAAGCPKVDYTTTVPKAKRRAQGVDTFDEGVFYQTRQGLWVDSDLERYVGLETRTTQGAAALQPPLRLVKDTHETELFGNVGSKQYQTTLAKAVDLGQIAGKIKAQWNGEAGELLTNGLANIFAVIGKDGALCVVYVHRVDGRWVVYCRLLFPGHVWFAGRLVFSN